MEYCKYCKTFHIRILCKHCGKPKCLQYEMVDCDTCVICRKIIPPSFKKLDCKKCISRKGGIYATCSKCKKPRCAANLMVDHEICIFCKYEIIYSTSLEDCLRQLHL